MQAEDIDEKAPTRRSRRILPRMTSKSHHATRGWRRGARMMKELDNYCLIARQTERSPIAASFKPVNGCVNATIPFRAAIQQVEVSKLKCNHSRLLPARAAASAGGLSGAKEEWISSSMDDAQPQPLVAAKLDDDYSTQGCRLDSSSGCSSLLLILKSRVNLYSPLLVLLLATSLVVMVAAAAAVASPSEAGAEILSIHQQPLTVRSDDNTNVEHKRWLDSSNLQVSSTSVFPAQKITKKSSSPLDHVSSADLPAEFRGLDDELDGDSVATSDSPPAREQSKLAKLCQQTSSVLASVLPAPFGGHKRSILCQFFGQVPQDIVQRPNLMQPHPIIRYPEPASIAVIQHSQQAPITMLASGRHPIQMVVEQYQQQQQQQQMMMMAQQPSPQHLGARPFVRQLSAPVGAGMQDLKSSASVVDYAYQQKLEPPASMRQHQLKSETPRAEKHNNKKLVNLTPVGMTFSPVKPPVSQPPAPTLSTSGWRIYNHSPDTGAATPSSPIAGKNQSNATAGNAFATKAPEVKLLLVSTTESVPTPKPVSRPTAVPLMNNNIRFQDNERAEPVARNKSIQSHANNQSEQAQLLVIGKPPSFHQRPTAGAASESQTSTTMATRQTSTLGKRSEALKSTTKPVDQAIEEASSDIRTIEVVAQQSVGNYSLDDLGKKVQSTIFDTTQMPLPAQPPAAKTASVNDLNQVQKREELVIASINNLTRIAFGNQLRDTVKVINKLIDQQAELFSLTNKGPSSFVSSAESGVAAAVAEGDKSKLKKSSINKSIASGGAGSKENLIYATTSTSKSRQKHIIPGTTPQQVKPTKKPKKQSRVQQQATSSTTTTSKPTSTTSSLLQASAKKSTSFIFQKLSTPSAAINESPRTPRSGSSEFRRSTLLHANDSRRLTHASSRSLGLGTAARRTTKPVDFDRIPAAATITDIRREKPLWQAKSPTTPNAVVSLSTARPSALSSAAGKLRSPTSTSYPWLLPDRTLYQSDLFGEEGLLSQTEGGSIVERPGSTQSYKRRTTRKEPLRTTLSAKQALVSNKIDNTIEPLKKLDSLTTLKMSLTTQSTPSTLSSVPPSISIQSRWIPTLTLMPTTTSTTTTTTTPAPPVTTASPQPKAPATTVKIDSQSTKEFASIKPNQMPPTLSDIYEARASDSISKYTTHWNEANELLATTRRFYQQPLPQTAQTGEYFNAETISIWPERYQTMIGQAQDGLARTTLSMETTRRNGETYETTNPLARHRYDANTFPANYLRTTPIDSAYLANMSSVTVLPSNHKLTTSNDNTVTYNLENAQTTNRIYEPTTRPNALLRNSVAAAGPGVAYTLIGPYTETETEIATSTPPVTDSQEMAGSGVAQVQELERFPDAVEDLLLPGGAKTRANSSNSLRPPYLGPLEGDQKSTDSTFAYDNQQAISKPHVTRKLYELLVPSTRNFVGSHNPLNQQRFNLSALKFLAQNILASPTPHYNDSIGLTPDSPVYLNQQNNSSNSSQKLLELLGESLPSNYYETLLNESSSDANKNFTGRTIIGRTDNLLNDLKQLEQKKAAAILAAIRYQVPSPLVRPWDLASDSISDLSTQMRDRLDDTDNDYIRDSLLFAQASRAAIKAAIARQRVISRDELEARLNGSKQFNSNDEMNSERRSDSHDVSYSVGDNDEFVFGNGSRHDDADYSLSNAGPLVSNKYNFTRSLLDKLLGSSTMRSNLNKTSDSIQNATYIDLNPADDLSSSKTQPLQNESTDAASSVNQYPKYIRFMDYRAWGGRTTGSESSPVKSHINKQHLPSSAIAAKLRENLARFRTTTESSDQSDSELKKMDKTKKDLSNQTAQSDDKGTNFDCTGKPSGFHPDTESACQTFYHCSSTGHLLTFNCPQQTRFDEKSLKCGPWFEVPCDLGRSKQKRLVA